MCQLHTVLPYTPDSSLNIRALNAQVASRRYFSSHASAQRMVQTVYEMRYRATKQMVCALNLEIIKPVPTVLPQCIDHKDHGSITHLLTPLTLQPQEWAFESNEDGWLYHHHHRHRHKNNIYAGWQAVQCTPLCEMCPFAPLQHCSHRCRCRSLEWLFIIVASGTTTRYNTACSSHRCRCTKNLHTALTPPPPPNTKFHTLYHCILSAYTAAAHWQPT